MRLPQLMSPADTSAATVAPAITVGTAPTSAPSRPQAMREREHPAPHGEAPDANARRSGRERAAEPEQADRGERDLELVSRAEEARAEDGVRAEERAAHQHRAERQVGHVQRHRDRGRQDQRPRPWAHAVRREGERCARDGDDQPLDRSAMEPARRSAAARSGATSRPAGRRVPAAVGRVAQARQARQSRRPRSTRARSRPTGAARGR